MSFLPAIKSGLAHLLFPELCEGCRMPLTTGELLLCLGCQGELARTGFHHLADNKAADRLAGRLPFRHATAFAHFGSGDLLQHLLHRLKYKGRKSVGIKLGRLFGEELLAAGWAGDIDGIVPVPLHPRKERARGYNQSALIAEGLGEVLQKPAWPNALRRSRHTESQTRKTRAERVANVSNVFELAKPLQVEGRHILLVDDVLTTGATLEQAAQALLQAKGTQISIATIGIAG